MRSDSTIYLQGIVLDDESHCSFVELCHLSGASADLVQEMVSEGIIKPEGEKPDSWRFTSITIHKVQTVVRLNKDLRVNLPGCALILELLEELDTLRSSSGLR
jgi:chaperone modulatory protein CbpM